jgi:CubicO group peptidase (beta-lactamase class C family)
MMLRALISTAALLLSTAAAAVPFSAGEAARVDALVAEALKTTGVPSASVAVVRDGEIAFVKAYGTQSPAIPAARTDAIYPIASVSKQFTAAALLLLEDEGKLSLDDKVAKYIPGISGGNRITIRQLLSHTSGLQDYWPQDYSFAAMEKPVTPQQIVDRWAKKPLDFEPGTQWQYSNTGYVVAGMIAEKVSGEPLLSFLQRSIFRPLGMHPIDQDRAIGKGFPVGYRRNALGPVRPETPAAPGWLYAAGELAMTAEDLARWDIARINRSLLPVEDWAEQERPVKLASGASSGYGLGVFLGEKRGRAMVDHGGEAVGFLSENTVFPQDRAAVVVLVNAWFGNAHGKIAEGIEEMLFPASATANLPDRTDLAKKVYAQLRSGTLDRSLLTEDANHYFVKTVLEDYRTSLGGLGEPESFVASTPRLRGGFVNRNYTLTFPDRKLRIVTYAEPGGAERFEQFLVMPIS